MLASLSKVSSIQRGLSSFTAHCGLLSRAFSAVKLNTLSYSSAKSCHELAIMQALSEIESASVAVMLLATEPPLDVVSTAKMPVLVPYPFCDLSYLSSSSFIPTVPTKVSSEDRPLSTAASPRSVSPTRRSSRRRFTPRHATPMAPLNLGRLQQWIDAGRIDTSRVITMKDLLDSRAVHKIQYGVKLLADVRLLCVDWFHRLG